MRPSTILGYVLAAALLLTSATSASAQPGISAPLSPPSSVEGPPPPLARLPKARPGAYRPVAAFFLSFGASVGLLATADSGVFQGRDGVLLGLSVVAPSVGRWYVGEIGLLGMTMRAGGIGLIASAFEDQSLPLLVGGATLFLGSTLYDMVGAGVTAQRQNERRWAAMPTALVSPRGDVTPGLALTGRF